MNVKSEIGIFSEHDFPAFGKHNSRKRSNRAVSVGIGGAIARQESKQPSEQPSVCKTRGGIGELEQRKHDGKERRRRQTGCKEVEGDGLGTDSSADKGEGRKQVHFDDVAGPPAPIEGQVRRRRGCF